MSTSNEQAVATFSFRDELDQMGRNLATLGKRMWSYVRVGRRVVEAMQREARIEELQRLRREQQELPDEYEQVKKELLDDLNRSIQAARDHYASELRRMEHLHQVCAQHIAYDIRELETKLAEERPAE